MTQHKSNSGTPTKSYTTSYYTNHITSEITKLIKQQSLQYDY